MHDETYMKSVAAAQEIVPKITCEEFWQREENGERPTVLDVREPWEWESGHIEEATNVPLSHVKDEAAHLYPEKGGEIIICCATDHRSALAGKQLMDMGYTNVKYLSGGYSGYCGGLDKPQASTEELES